MDNARAKGSNWLCAAINIEDILDVLECPTCHGGSFVAADKRPLATGLVCDFCGAFFNYHNGILELLTEEDKNSLLVHKALGRLDTRLYELFIARGGFRRLFSTWNFEEEVRQTISLFDLFPEHMVLDIGCGTGNYTLEFARQANKGITIGLDLSSAMLEQCKANIYEAKARNVLLIRANAGNLPFKNSSLSRVYLGCLHLVNDIDLCLSNAHRVLVPGGILLGMTFFASRKVIWRQLQKLLTRLLYSHPLDSLTLREHVIKAGFAGFQCNVKSYGQFRAVKH